MSGTSGTKASIVGGVALVLTGCTPKWESAARQAVESFAGAAACGSRGTVGDSPDDAALLSQAPPCPKTHAELDVSACKETKEGETCIAHGRAAKDGPDLVDYCLVRRGEAFKVDVGCTVAGTLARQYHAADDCKERGKLAYAPAENASTLEAIAAASKSCKADVAKLDLAACQGALHAAKGRCVANVSLAGDKSSAVCVRRDEGKVSVDLRCTEGLDGPDGRRVVVKVGATYDAKHSASEFTNLELSWPGPTKPQLAWIRKDDARPAMAKLREASAPTKVKLAMRPAKKRDWERIGKVIPDRWLVTDVLGEGFWQEEPAQATGKCPAGMAYVAGGPVMLGRDEDDAKVTTLAPYCLDVTEVTVRAVKECHSSRKCLPGYYEAYCNIEKPERLDHPMNCIDWNESKIYCEAQGKRLPTQMEWELAARGYEGHEFPWGDTPPTDQLCWKGVESRMSSCPVGSLPKGRSPFGIDDLAGNVWEWTSSEASEWDRHYLSVGNGTAYIYRGGGWVVALVRDMLSTRPSGFTPNGRAMDLGFRCAAAPLP